MKTYYLNARLVPSHLKAGYSGKQFQAQACEDFTIPAGAGLWSGGSRNTFTVIRLTDGKTISPVNHNAAPWDKSRKSITIKLKPGIAIIEHSIVCGKDLGLRFYVHPNDIAPMLPPPVLLTNHERTVLEATKCYKASYNGQDRYQMARPHNTENRKAYPTREQWAAAKQTLIARKLLNKAGAITVTGKNAIA